MYDLYQDFYKRVISSKTFKKYCELLFGEDLSQDGFADIDQLNTLIKYLGITSSDTCLDIGCGNGKIANFVYLKTKAKLHGVDYSENAIRCANEDFKSNSLSFSVGDINSAEIIDHEYTVIYLIDTIYFSDNYEQCLSKLFNSLPQKGRIGILYSEFVFEASRQTIKIEANKTRIAEVIEKNKWKHFSYDLCLEHYELMKKRKRIANLLRNEFMEEGNEVLFRKISTESIDESMTFEEFVKFTNRYLYCIEKGNI